MKKCPKCGKELADDAVFCNGCGEKLDATPANDAAPANNAAPAAGAPVPPPAAPAPGAMTPPPVNPGMPPVNAPAQAPKNNNKMIGIIAVAAVAVVAVILAILLLGSLGGGAKGPVKTVVGLVNRHSTDVYAFNNTVQPASLTSSYKSLEGLMKGGDAKDDIKEAIEDEFDEMWDDLEDTYGDNWKITLEFSKVERMDKDDLEDLQDDWEDSLDDLEDSKLDDEDTWEFLAEYLDDEKDTDFDEEKAAAIFEKFINKADSLKLTAAYEVKVKVTIKGKDDKDSETFKLTVVKVAGKWMIDTSSGDYYSFASFITCGHSGIIDNPAIYYVYD